MLINKPHEPQTHDAPAECRRRRGRPARARSVAELPPVPVFKPAGVPARTLHRITLGVDEFEALRLVDGDGLDHAQAALSMGVSRQTVGRIVQSGRHKLVSAISGGFAIAIEGGAYDLADTCDGRRRKRCCETPRDDRCDGAARRPQRLTPGDPAGNDRNEADR